MNIYNRTVDEQLVFLITVQVVPNDMSEGNRLFEVTDGSIRPAYCIEIGLPVQDECDPCQNSIQDVVDTLHRLLHEDALRAMMDSEKLVNLEMPWDDYDDDGGFDDDSALHSQRPMRSAQGKQSLADRISAAGLRDLLGFAGGLM